MNFTETPIAGAVVIEFEPVADERGLFARTFSADDFEAKGLDPRVTQCNLSVNARRGTLRGLHYQVAPHGEAKLVRCSRGALFDVVVDLRPTSATYCDWFGVDLTDENHRMLFIPEGLAHGFQTLEDGTEVVYQMSAPYVAEAARGIRWDDPAFAIEWPAERVRLISERDRTYSDFSP